MLSKAVDACASSIKISPKNLFKADKIYYNENEDFAEATGHVRIINGDQYLKTNSALIDVKNKKLWINSTVFGQTSKQKLLASSVFMDEGKGRLIARDPKVQLNNNEILTAKLLVRKNENETDIYQASYTPCVGCINNNPVWQIDAQKTSIDFKKNTITYRHAFFKLGGFRIAYLPYFSHSMPSNKSKSGVLMPSPANNNTLRVPLYYSIKPNMDITYTPRFNTKIFIHELEYRHLLESGTYQVKGSYTKSNNTSKNKHSGSSDRYNISSVGNFGFENLRYGYDVNRVSDKSYLKNFYRNNTNFLKSEIFLESFYDNGYNHIDVQHYQGLRTEDSKITDPNALPNLKIRRDYELFGGVDFKIEDNAIQYIQAGTKSISRNSLDLDFNKSFFGESGQSLSASIHNKMDMYKVQNADYAPNYNNGAKVKDKTLFRNIPELKTNMRWPIYVTTASSVYVIEPEMNLIIGRNSPSKINKYSLIDSPNYDINECNIFENSRYSGIDYYEYGRRFSYGLNQYIMGENSQTNLFIGQLIRSEIGTSDSKSDYVGKISYNYSDNLELYYRFQRKQKQFAPYRDEISAWYNVGKFSLQNTWISLRDLKEYSKVYDLSEVLKENSIRQNFTQASYKLTSNITLFGDIRLDLSNKSKTKVLSDSIGATYSMDCATFTIKLYNDYTSDPTRNIKKTRSWGGGIALKTLNM